MPAYLSAAQAKLHINQPSGDVELNLTIGVNPPTSKEIPYRDLFILLEDTNVFMSEMAGALSWFTPSMDELAFTFDQPATISIKSKKKTYQFKTDKEFKISISIMRKLMKENPLVVFSDLPIEMSPQD